MGYVRWPGNVFGDSGIEHLANVLKHRKGKPQNTSITEIDVRDCLISGFGAMVRSVNQNWD